MTRRNGQIHFDQFKPSTQDDIALAEAVEDRCIQLLNGWLKMRGERLSFPPDLRKDILQWKAMRRRHKRGDFRHSAAELKSTKTVAQWTITMNCKLRNQPEKQLHWKD